MKLAAIIGGSMLALFVVIGIVIALNYQNLYNENNNFNVLCKAQEKVMTVTFDNSWKIISQQAQVSEKYKDGFQEIFVGSAKALGSGGDLMKFIQQANPNFDSSIYATLMNTITAKRTEFKEAQTKAIAIQEAQEKFLTNMYLPGITVSRILGGAKPYKLTLVTSDKTKNAFVTGSENDVDLYK